jgi:hypothetical protein
MASPLSGNRRLPHERLELCVDRRLRDMVGVIAERLHGHAKEDLEHLFLREAGIKKLPELALRCSLLTVYFVSGG